MRKRGGEGEDKTCDRRYYLDRTGRAEVVGEMSFRDTAVLGAMSTVE